MHLRPALVVALLVIIAGCIGISGEPSQRTETDGRPTETVTPQTTIQSIETTTDRKVTIAEEDMLEFKRLPEKGQEAFLSALNGEAKFGPPYLYDYFYDNEVLDNFNNAEYISYNGSVYRIEISQDDRIYQSRTYKMKPADPDRSENIIGYNNLSNKSKNVFLDSLNNRYTVPFGDKAPELFTDSGPKYVRYKNKTFAAVTTNIREASPWSMTVTEVNVFNNNISYIEVYSCVCVGSPDRSKTASQAD